MVAFKTEKFEGPLDLMLHLIREQQLDIFDLDMEVLTDQYIEYLHQMEVLELEVESEYLFYSAGGVIGYTVLDK